MEVKSENIKYKADDDEISAQLSQPSAQGSYPGVVLIHEIFGLDGHTRSVAERLAAEGYIVLAPHLFSSKKLSKTLTDEGIGEAMKFMMSIPPEKQRDEKYREEQMAKLSEDKRNMVIGVYTTLFIDRPVELFTSYLSYAVEHLKTVKGFNGKVGSAGFCFGGGMSINLGCTGKTDATVIFYGENPSPIDKVKDAKCAVMGLYGGEDARINSNIDQLVKALVENRRPFTIKVFPGAHHAFFNSDRPQTYNRDAAEESWRMLLKFFKDNL
ncbi:MAG: dienelactone hydrolase family protein [Candidatus Micrarchaeaceae archaeon]